MLKINKKLKLPLIFSVLGISGVFLYQYLTFIPEYSTAAPISTDTPVTITPTTPLAKWDDNLQYMQQMTPQACADAKVGDSKTLTDNTAGTNSNKTYTVQKMEINNECWMTENMDNEAGRDWHEDAYGGYYDWEQAKIICAKMGSGWELPSQTQQQNIISSGYNAGMKLVDSPYKFKYGGFFHSEYGVRFSGESGYGYYWSSTPSGNIAYALTFNSYSAEAKVSNFPQYGYSVRCVAKTTSDVTPIDPSESVGSGINDPTVSVIVPNIITLDVSDSVDVTTESNKVNTDEFTATVSSNKEYAISLNATTDASDATALVNYKEGNKVGEIKTVEGNEQPEAGKSGWGIRACTGLEIENCTGDYLGLPVKGETNSFVDGTKGVNRHMFQIGIGIGPELPSGTYSTSILVTASQK